MSFVTDIQLMMHGFGDCRKPLPETAAVIESVVHQQMTLFLHQATDIAEQRGSRLVGPEDILFIMRKDPLKLQRLVHYMGVRDLYQRTRSSTSGSSTGEVQELGIDPSTEVSRKKLCTSFLQSIDQYGQYDALCSSSIYDPVVAERATRLDNMTQGMSCQRYKEYCDARKASFCPRLRVNKFREWLLRDESGDVKLTQLVLEMLNRLAYETVAQIVDLALLVKRDATGHTSDLSRFRTPTALNPDYPCVFIHQINGRTDGQSDGQTDGQSDGQMKGRTDAQINGRTDGQTNGWTNGRTDGQTNGRTDGQMKGWLKGQMAGWTSGSLQEMGSSDDHNIGMEPITPAQVREAVRRYWANNSLLAPFSKICSPINTRLLAA